MLNAQTQSKSVVEWDAPAYHRLSDMQFEVAMAFLGAAELSPPMLRCWMPDVAVAASPRSC